jgi:hypothetical protein
MNYRNEKQAADRVLLSVSYLKKIRHTGGGPKFIKVGARVIYTDDDLDEWLASQKVSSTSEASLRAQKVA